MKIPFYQETWFGIDLNALSKQENLSIESVASEKLYHHIYKELNDISGTFDSIMCVAGGWIGGSIKDKEIFSSLDQMNSMNVKTALLSILK